MFKFSSYCFAFCLSAYALLHGGDEQSVNQQTLLLLGGAPGPCYVAGTSNCPPPDLSFKCSSLKCNPHPTNPAKLICELPETQGNGYVEQEQANTTYAVAQATKMTNGKKEIVEGNEIICVVNRFCDTCVWEWSEFSDICQRDGGLGSTIQSRTTSSPGGDACTSP